MKIRDSFYKNRIDALEKERKNLIEDLQIEINQAEDYSSSGSITMKAEKLSAVNRGLLELRLLKQWRGKQEIEK